MPSQFYRRSFLIVAAALLAYALYQVLMPLRAELGWAAVLAFTLYPLQERLSRRLKGRRAVSAGILTAPYMHDGRFATLEAVLGHYSDLARHPKEAARIDRRLPSAPLTAEERGAINAIALKAVSRLGMREGNPPSINPQTAGL